MILILTVVNLKILNQQQALDPPTNFSIQSFDQSTIWMGSIYVFRLKVSLILG